jgi:hypothetical protein
MQAGVPVPIPYNPALWVADSDRGVLQFTAAPAQLGYAPPFSLTYQQYARQGFVEVQKDLQVDGSATVFGALTVCGATTYSGGQVYAGDLTVCGALYALGRGAFSSSVSVSGPLQVAGAVSVSGGLALSGPISLAGAGVGVSGYVLTSQGGATPAWRSAGAGNYLPVSPASVTAPTSVTVSGTTLTFTTAADAASAFRIQDAQSSRYPLIAGRNGLRLATASGDAAAFNALFTSPAFFMPTYFTFTGTVAGTALNLPDPSLYAGVQLTIKSSGASVATASITSPNAPSSTFGSLLLPGEKVPSAPAAKSLNLGGVFHMFSDGTYWNATSVA